MKATAGFVVLLAGLVAVSAFTVDVDVPAEPGYGDEVILKCNYQLERGETIQSITWTKDGVIFMTYGNDEYSFNNIDGINIDRKRSTPRRVILTDVQDSASGLYGVRMTVASTSAGSSNVQTFSRSQDMAVGGPAAGDTLGNRFGGTAQRRPAGGSTITTFSSSSSSSSGSTGPVGGGLGNRFGGNRPSGGAAGTASGFGATGSDVRPLAADVPPPRPVAAVPPPQVTAANGLAAAQANLQNAVNELQNALNAALGR